MHPDESIDRLRAELTDRARPDGPVPRLLRELGWTPPPPAPPPSRPRLPETGDLVELLAGGCSVHEAAARLATPVDVLRAELVTLRRAHACTSTAEVVRRVRAGH